MLYDSASRANALLSVLSMEQGLDFCGEARMDHQAQAVSRRPCKPGARHGPRLFVKGVQASAHPKGNACWVHPPG